MRSAQICELDRNTSTERTCDCNRQSARTAGVRRYLPLCGVAHHRAVAVVDLSSSPVQFRSPHQARVCYRRAW